VSLKMQMDIFKAQRKWKIEIIEKKLEMKNKIK
jgi:hypothetical protein